MYLIDSSGITDFYPRPPRGGRHGRFHEAAPETLDFYPRPPRGGRPGACRQAGATYIISIHVPREGDDGCYTSFFLTNKKFLSTSPARGTTMVVQAGFSRKNISIHVPREGDDRVPGPSIQGSRYFYPRPPRGGRLSIVIYASTMLRFLSTSPARGTTVNSNRSNFINRFLSTSPARGTTVPLGAVEAACPISIHVPREGDDGACRQAGATYIISIHVPREGDDLGIRHPTR